MESEPADALRSPQQDSSRAVATHGGKVSGTITQERHEWIASAGDRNIAALAIRDWLIVLTEYLDIQVVRQYFVANFGLDRHQANFGHGDDVDHRTAIATLQLLAERCGHAHDAGDDGLRRVIQFKRFASAPAR